MREERMTSELRLNASALGRGSEVVEALEAAEVTFTRKAVIIVPELLISFKRIPNDGFGGFRK